MWRALVGAKPSRSRVHQRRIGGQQLGDGAAAGQTILTSGIEHDSVLAPARATAAEVMTLPAGADGVVRVEEIAEHV